MTDKLVERLRAATYFAPSYGVKTLSIRPDLQPDDLIAAADLLEAQQARIVELERLAGDNTTLFFVLANIREQSGVGVKPMLSELARAIGDRVRALEDALRPFANDCPKGGADWTDGDLCGVTYADLRRAKQVLEGE